MKLEHSIIPFLLVFKFLVRAEMGAILLSFYAKISHICFLLLDLHHKKWQKTCPKLVTQFLSSIVNYNIVK